MLPGNYSLFALVPGRIGDYIHPTPITIKPGTVFGNSSSKNIKSLASCKIHVVVHVLDVQDL